MGAEPIMDSYIMLRVPTVAAMQALSSILGTRKDARPCSFLGTPFALVRPFLPDNQPKICCKLLHIANTI